MSFKDKVVLVTGGSAGIGASTVLLFAKEGAKVVFNGRNEERLKNVTKQCEDLGADVLAIKADVTKEADLKTILQKTIDKYGKLDVLVNNAGIYRKADLIEENYMEIFNSVIDTNLRSVAFLTSIAAPYIIKTTGNIVNISSVASTTAKSPSYSAYKVSKAALDHFTRCIAVELAPLGVRVNSVNPGPVYTDILYDVGLSFDSFAQYTALGRVSDPEEIADLIAYVASDKARSVTGSIYLIDAGISIR